MAEPASGQIPHTLLLRLAGPMQSWGTQSRFTYRETDTEPSKSGVIGLVACALGRERSAPVDDLASLSMGVRVDFEGVLRRDYQTIGGTHRRADQGYGVVNLEGKINKFAIISPRWYLANADFLVGLAGEGPVALELLKTIAKAIRNPAWPLFLGRKAFPPGVPVSLPLEAGSDGPSGLRPGSSLENALQDYPWPRPDLADPRIRFVRERVVWKENEPPAVPELRLFLESQRPDAQGRVRSDQPFGVSYRDRVFVPRIVEVHPCRTVPLHERLLVSAVRTREAVGSDDPASRVSDEIPVAESVATVALGDPAVDFGPEALRLLDDTNGGGER